MRIRPPQETRYDVVSLGECMVRLSPPGSGRIEFADTLEVHVGGGEYNLAYALARYGLRTAWIGGLVDNPLGALVRNHGRAVGVDMSRAVTVPFDGIGRRARMGLNFTEVGAGIRGSVTVYDRGYTPTSQLAPGDVDWEELFRGQGVRWFHTGGIFTCLSPGTRAVAAEAVRAAHDAGVMVSYDLNYRSNLWDSATAIGTTVPLLPFIDCLIGNEEDFQKVLGYEIGGVDENLSRLPVEGYQDMVRRVVKDHPTLSLVGTTLREVVSASVNSWSALLYEVATDTFHHGPRYPGLEVVDRVGGGDGFASGLVLSLLEGEDAARAVHVGTVHGALLQTTRGDTSQLTLEELRRAVAGGGARIRR